ncbi:MAG: family 78 glycoside hydrolase catalytic domain [Terriglobia bacterium]
MPLFSEKAHWIWDQSDRWSYHYYLQARRRFSVDSSEWQGVVTGHGATLKITADAYYQVWLNGKIVGHGPAKSAEGRRSVDSYDISEYLRTGENELDILALGMGVGTEGYSPAEAGLIFELAVASQRIVSDGQTQVKPDPARRKRTVRRWILPCMEDYDAVAADQDWMPATIVEKSTDLYARRVPLPTREILCSKRFVLAEEVRLQNISVSQRLRPYLTDGEQKRRCNEFSTPAYLVTDIHSPVDQTLTFMPALGQVTWYFGGRKLFEGSGWRSWIQTQPPVQIELKKGPNRLIGLHNHRNHFEDINLCGYAEQPVQFVNPFGKGGFQVVRMSRPEDLVEGPALEKVDWEGLRPHMLEMDPLDTMPFGNSYDLIHGARRLEPNPISLGQYMKTAASDPIRLAPAPDNRASRVILDLGVVHNGWLSFEVEGRAGSRLIFVMFEGLEPGPPMRIQWPNAGHNAITYRLRDGYQTYESFFSYGVRYVAIHHTGPEPVIVRDLRVSTANCGSQFRGFLRCDDELVNSIYQICAQSVISGVDDTFTDCPTWEQVNWNCDNALAAQGDAVTCFNMAVVRNTIELFAEDKRYRGLVRSQYPSAWESQIPLWAYHWLMLCRDYFWRAVDHDFLERIMPRVTAGIEEGLSKIGSRGLLEWPDVWHFIDWSRGRDDKHAIMTGEQAGFAGALAAATQLAEQAGPSYRKQAARWREAREHLIEAVNTTLWSPERNAYADSLHEDGTLSQVSSQATNAALVVYGVVPDERGKMLAQRILANDPAFIHFGSPFGLYYILEMLDRFGDVENIFRLVRERWGEMVMAGDTCTWETFAEFGYDDWPTRSRCHPFGAFVAKYMAKYLLGIQMQDPGYARFRVSPKPPKGLSSCNGAVPTTKGLIRVGWKIKGGTMDLHVEHPEELQRIV